MSEHVLSASDRAVLQGLVTLAGTVGIGAFLAPFLARSGNVQDGRPPLAVLESFVVMVILASAGTTAYFGIALLHDGKAISDGDLWAASAPLLLAVVLLAVLGILARFPARLTQLAALGPTLLGVFVIALGIGGASWLIPPDDIGWAAPLVFIGGLVFYGIARYLEGRGVAKAREDEREQLLRLSGGGYLRDSGLLRPTLPTPDAADVEVLVVCWTRKGRRYLDLAECQRLRDLVDERWRAFATGSARPPAGSSTLARVKVQLWCQGRLKTDPFAPVES